jgi:hypothetical protein
MNMNENPFPETPFRLTVVLEYPSSADVPPIGAATVLHGIGSVKRFSFTDALEGMDAYESALEEISRNCLEEKAVQIAETALEFPNKKL